MKTSPRLLALALGLFGCGHAVSAPADPCSTPSLDPSLSAKIHAATTRDSDEGMWLLNAFPSERVKQKYGFAPSAEFLDHVRLSSVRLTLGCSGSIVSPSGLVMTNHHCASECLAELSTADRDLIQRGYLAKSTEEEIRCPAMEVNQLVGITDVTARIAASTKGASPSGFHDAQRAEIARIEKECASSDDVRCDVVDLYHGGQYHLYRYRRFLDVRLVFAPEMAAAFFGGDPDNFNFPRYDLDVTFLRIFEGGRPAKMDHFLKWSPAGAKEGDLTFVSGHPGGTSRLLTVAELVHQRDFVLPDYIERLAQLRGELTQFQTKGPEQARTSNELLFGIENSLKALRGEREALTPALLGQKAAEEQTIREKVLSDASLSDARTAWDAIVFALAADSEIATSYALLERRRGFDGDLFGYARTLVRAATELGKANDARLEEYGDAELPALKARLFSTAPVHAELEAMRLGSSLTRMREKLGADDAIVRKVLGKDAPRELASTLVAKTKLDDPAVRKALFEGGKSSIDASTDPMIELARRIDSDARSVRARYEREVDGPLQQSREKIAKARFATFGTSVYPDATFTLRLAYGSVKGWNDRGQRVDPFTRFDGAFARATGKDPFALPQSWLDAKSKLALDTPLNFVTTNDIVGGNSGSPMIDKDGRVVGLVFDGNIHSLGGEYWFDDAKNRAVAVHSEAIVHALDHIYGAGRIASELVR